MNKNLIKAGIIGVSAILLATPLIASAWDHELDNTAPHQGSDGTVWATITGTPYSNKAGLNLPDALCGIGFHQSPIAINLTSDNTPIATNIVTGAPDQK